MRSDGNFELVGFTSHHFVRVIDPCRYDRVLNHRICADDVNRLAPLLGRQFGHRQPRERLRPGAAFGHGAGDGAAQEQAEAQRHPEEHRADRRNDR